MHLPTAGILYYVHVSFWPLKFWFRTGRIISHPVWHASFSRLTLGPFFFVTQNHLRTMTRLNLCHWSNQQYELACAKFLCCVDSVTSSQSSSSASHDQGPGLVANHHRSHEFQVHVIDTTRRYIHGDSSPSWRPQCVRLHAFFFGFPVYFVCTLRQSHVIICIIVS